MMFIIHKVLQDMEKSLARNKIYLYTKIWGFYHELNDIIFSNLVLSQHLENAASKKKKKKKELQGATMLLLLLSRVSRSVVSDSVRPHRRQPTRLLHPWDYAGKNTGVGCHFPFQCMKVKSEVAQSNLL